MLTQCPACSAMFRLHAADLAAAHGFVECGACGETFNALLRLADELPRAPDRAPADATPGAASAHAPAASGAPPVRVPASLRAEIPTPAPASAEPDGGSPAPEAAARDPVPRPSRSGATGLHGEAHRAAASDGSAAPTPGWGAAPAARRGAPPAARPRGASAASDAAGRASRTPRAFASRPEIDLDGMPPIRAAEPAGDAHADAPRVELRLDDVPAILREDLARLRRPRSGARLLWTALSVVLLLALAVQLAWTYREPLLARHPRARPPLERICTLLTCRVDVPRDSSAIELVARDVRAHPEYAHTLLVNANIVNQGEERAAYPVVQLALLDAGGEYLGVRRFDPADYLDDSIDVAAGLPAGRTVYIVLEIADAADRAAGFEFDFF